MYIYGMTTRVVACLALVLVAAASAVAKEGMSATLIGQPRFDAPAGTRITIAWKLGTTSAQAARGDDDRFYVRLISATGARSTHAYGKLRKRRYVATVRIPRGGVGDVEIRLKGWQVTPSGSRRADMLIPIANDPFP
jgi:hypothetical protein